MRSFIAALAVIGAQAFETSKYSTFSEKQQANGTFSPITLTIDGVDTTKYLVTDWCSSSGKEYICAMNNRGYIMDTPNWDATNPQFYTPNLLGGYIEWDTDVSAFECGCLNTFYTVKMPGRDWGGSFDTKNDHWFYCDANVQDSLCPEMDLQEANKYSYATTPHKCNSPDGDGHYTYCDGAGQCALNIVEQLGGNDYGPGSQYAINTEQPYHVKVSFEDTDANGNLQSITTTFTQGANTRTMQTQGCSYLQDIDDDISNGMAFVVSAWGEGITDPSVTNWLTKDRCYGTCNVAAQETIKNISIKVGTVKPSGGGGGGYDPTKFDFGDGCATATDGQCGDESCPSVDHCRWSWNKGGRWDDPSADCRCDIAV